VINCPTVTIHGQYYCATLLDCHLPSSPCIPLPEVSRTLYTPPSGFISHWLLFLSCPLRVFLTTIHAIVFFHSYSHICRTTYNFTIILHISSIFLVFLLLRPVHSWSHPRNYVDDHLPLLFCSFIRPECLTLAIVILYWFTLYTFLLNPSFRSSTTTLQAARGFTSNYIFDPTLHLSLFIVFFLLTRIVHIPRSLVSFCAANTISYLHQLSCCAFLYSSSIFWSPEGRHIFARTVCPYYVNEANLLWSFALDPSSHTQRLSL